QVLNHSQKLYKKVPFSDGPDTDNAAFYKKKYIKLISTQQLYTDLRDISEYHFNVKRGSGKRTKFRLYSLHLKAGTSSADKQQRADEAQFLRAYLDGFPSNSLFIVLGDFNFYTSSEPGFQTLISNQGDTDGMALDPLDELGSWNNKKKYASLHTQSTHKKQKGGFIGGGLDDRFDMFLISSGFENSKKLAYVPDSYIAYGNDGKHFNKNINKPNNTAVSKELADALYNASDHLPVVIELLPPDDPDAITVYITETGTKYHRGSCHYLSKSKIAISLAEAVKQGYTPCSVCKPPTLTLTVYKYNP
ncbi:hypothetical protein ACFLR7_07175, partial [Acidobacteriota bacterium]